jgi:predicted small secreted protein
MALVSRPAYPVAVENPQIKAMKTPLTRTALLILASALAVIFSTSCGTVRGFGRDVETVGGGIEQSAR